MGSWIVTAIGALDLDRISFCETLLDDRGKARNLSRPSLFVMILETLQQCAEHLVELHARRLPSHDGVAEP